MNVSEEASRLTIIYADSQADVCGVYEQLSKSFYFDCGGEWDAIQIAKIGQQAIPPALAEGERLLESAGAIRVHGGGFAGTAQVFVPNERLEHFKPAWNRFWGKVCAMFSIFARRAAAWSCPRVCSHNVACAII